MSKSGNDSSDAIESYFEKEVTTLSQYLHYDIIIFNLYAASKSTLAGCNTQCHI